MHVLAAPSHHRGGKGAWLYKPPHPRHLSSGNLLTEGYEEQIQLSLKWFCRNILLCLNCASGFFFLFFRCSNFCLWTRHLLFSLTVRTFDGENPDGSGIDDGDRMGTLMGVAVRAGVSARQGKGRGEREPNILSIAISFQLQPEKVSLCKSREEGSYKKRNKGSESRRFIYGWFLVCESEDSWGFSYLIGQEIRRFSIPHDVFLFWAQIQNKHHCMRSQTWILRHKVF